MRKRVLAIALAVVAAIALVALRWHSIVPPPPPELPSSHPKAARRPSPIASQLAYRESEADDGAPDWELTGVVIDGQARPVPGARLDFDLLCLHGAEEGPTIHADASGRFALPLLPDCTIWLYASHGDESARVLVGRLTSEPITVQLIPDNDVVLRVIDAVSRAPVGGVRVTEAACQHATCADVVGDADGTVRLPRAHELRIEAAGYGAKVIDLQIAWHSLEDGTVAIEQTVELPPLLRVHGQAIDAHGTPIVGVHMSGSYEPGAFGVEMSSGETDEEGRFELVVPFGTWISGTKLCADQRMLWVDGTAVNGEHVVLRSRQSGPCAPAPLVALSPPPPSTPPPPQPPPPPEVEVVVTVVDETGRPVPKAEIWSFSNNMPPGRADGTGRYVFRTRGIGDLYARRGERMSPLATVGADHREVTLRIEPSAITGHVVDGDGRPAAKVWVRIRMPWQHPWNSAVNATRDYLTTADGRFGFVLPPGRYLISTYDEVAGFDYDGPNATVISTNTRDVTFEIP
jgi:hypothetical protein